MSDARDILGDDTGPTELVRETNESRRLSAAQRKKEEKKQLLSNFRKPDGMNRELFALLLADNKDPNSPIIPTDILTPVGGGGYKQVKAKLGLKKARPWKWIPFNNPGRKDGFRLHHWRRVADEGKEYPFSKFNTTVSIANYSDAEYQQHLQIEGWTKAETDHLFDLCKRFDLRFLIISDRWDLEAFPTKRSVEDLKERYYNAVNVLAKASAAPGLEPKLKMYDANHERKRKEQLIKLYERTPEQIEEEQNLIEELRKIDMRKKEREKKTQDLQKLITAADNSSLARGKTETPGNVNRPGRGGPGRKKLSMPKATGTKLDSVSTPGSAVNLLDSTGIKFPEQKSSGASLRSQRMKLPASVGQKKSKAIDQLLGELSMDLRPMPTEEICTHFNDLRSDMVLLYELKMALANCEFELQTLKHQYEALQPPKGAHEKPASAAKAPATPKAATAPEGPSSSAPEVTTEPPSATPVTPAPIASGAEPKKAISEVIDVSPVPGTPNRKRKAAIEQQALLKKLRKNIN